MTFNFNSSAARQHSRIFRLQVVIINYDKSSTRQNDLNVLISFYTFIVCSQKYYNFPAG